jgi:hypothetical protein
MVDQSSPPPSSPISSQEQPSPAPSRPSSPLPPSSPPDLSDSQWDQGLNDEDLMRGFASAVSANDRALLKKFREELMKVQMEHCDGCHET